MLLLVLIVSSLLKIFTLASYESYNIELHRNTFIVICKTLITCFIEHVAFMIPILGTAVESLAMIGKEYEKSKKLYFAIAIFEIGKIIILFLQIWDSEPILLMFLCGCLMLSLQFIGFQCVSPTLSNWQSIRIFFLAVVCKVLCRVYFHSLFHTLALGIFL